MILAYSLGKPVPASSTHRVLLLQLSLLPIACTHQVRGKVQAPPHRSHGGREHRSPALCYARAEHSAAVGLV